jgi:hypothetical protein
MGGGWDAVEAVDAGTLWLVGPPLLQVPLSHPQPQYPMTNTQYPIPNDE